MSNDVEVLTLTELPKRLPKPQIMFVGVILFCGLVGSFGVGNLLGRRKAEREFESKLNEKQQRADILEKNNSELGIAMTGMQNKVKEMEARIGFFSTYLKYTLVKEKFWIKADEVCASKHKVFPSALVPLDAPEMKDRKAALEDLGEYVEKLRLYGKEVEIKNLIVNQKNAGENATIQFSADLTSGVWILPGELQRQAAK